jgi:hypothetical protein
VDFQVGQWQGRRWRCVACVGVAVVGVTMLTLCNDVSRGAGGSWEESAIATEPEAIDVARDESLTLTVSLAYSGAVSTEAEMTCTLDAGSVTDIGSEVHLAAADAITWSGTVTPFETTEVEWSAWPSSWPTMTVDCTIDGAVPHTLSRTVVVTPITYIFPIVFSSGASPAPTGALTVPVSLRWVQSTGEDHAEAYATTGVRASAGGWLNVNLETSTYGEYVIERSFAQASIPDLGSARVVSAGLSVVPCSEWHPLLDPLPAPVVSFHPGTWQGDVQAINRAVLWQSYDESTVIGSYDASDIYGTDCELSSPDRVVIPLDPAYITSGSAFRLAVRDHEDDVDLRPAFAAHSRRWRRRPSDPVWLEIGVGDTGGMP